MLADAKKPLNPAAASAAAPPSVSKPEPNEHPGLAPGSSANTSVANALKGVEFIAQHIKDEDRDNEVSSDILTLEIAYAACLYCFVLDTASSEG